MVDGVRDVAHSHLGLPGFSKVIDVSWPCSSPFRGMQVIAAAVVQPLRCLGLV